MAIRTPAKIVGSASGNSTLSRILDLLNPMPRAASTASTGTPLSPTTVLRNTTSNAYNASATTTVQGDKPKTGHNTEISASDGIV